MAENHTSGAMAGMTILPLSAEERRDLLRRRDWIGASEWAQASDVARYMLACEAPAGEVVCREGEEEPYMFLLIDGAVDVFKRDETGKDRKIAVIDPGRSFGEMSFVDGLPRSATCVVAEKSTFLVMTRDTFGHLLDDAPVVGCELLLRISRVMSLRLRRNNTEMLEDIPAVDE